MTTRLDALIALAADRAGDRTALLQDSATLSYAELDQLVSRVAAGLLSLGLEKQARVGVYLPKRFETVAAFFGIARAGLVFVPVNPLLKAQQVTHILRDCNVQCTRDAARPGPRPGDGAGGLPGSRDAGARGRRRVDRRTAANGHLGATDGERRPAHAASRDRHRHGVDLLHLGQHREAEGRGAVAPEHARRRRERLDLPREHRRRPAARGAAVQLRLRLQPAHDRVPRRRERGADGLPLRTRRAEGARAASRHRARRGSAAVDPARPRCRGPPASPSTCATSRTPAAACRARRSSGCASCCRRPGLS